MKNIYYHPETHGLEIFGTADVDESYSFSMFVAWKDAHGQFYYGSDAGCSCPSPFEDCNSLEDLTKATVPEVHAALDKWAAEQYSNVSASVAELHAKLAAV